MPVKALITSLKFKASNIAMAEDRYKMDFFSALDKVGTSMKAMLFLFCAGGGDEELFDQFMAEKGIKELVLLILDGVNEAGFLGEKLDLNKVRATIDKATAEAAKSQEALLNTGEKTND